MNFIVLKQIIVNILFYLWKLFFRNMFIRLQEYFFFQQVNLNEIYIDRYSLGMLGIL